MDELVARVEALGRRGATPTAADLLKVADLHMDVQHRRVTRAGKIIALSPREFDVLQVLMQEPGRVFSRTELCERIWQRDHEYDTRRSRFSSPGCARKWTRVLLRRSSTRSALSGTPFGRRSDTRFFLQCARYSAFRELFAVR